MRSSRYSYKSFSVFCSNKDKIQPLAELGAIIADTVEEANVEVYLNGWETLYKEISNGTRKPVTERWVEDCLAQQRLISSVFLYNPSAYRVKEISGDLSEEENDDESEEAFEMEDMQGYSTEDELPGELEKVGDHSGTLPRKRKRKTKLSNNKNSKAEYSKNSKVTRKKKSKSSVGTFKTDENKTDKLEKRMKKRKKVAESETKSLEESSKKYTNDSAKKKSKSKSRKRPEIGQEQENQTTTWDESPTIPSLRPMEMPPIVDLENNMEEKVEENERMESNNYSGKTSDENLPSSREDIPSEEVKNFEDTNLETSEERNKAKDEKRSEASSIDEKEVKHSQITSQSSLSKTPERKKLIGTKVTPTKRKSFKSPMISENLQRKVTVKRPTKVNTVLDSPSDQ